MMFDHDHHTHADHDGEEAPVGAVDDHEQVFARDVAKDQLRASGATGSWIALLAFATWLIAATRPVAGLRTLRQRRETDPPLALAWQFVQRCAPDSAAPPALA